MTEPDQLETPGVIIDGAVPRTPFERIQRIIYCMADDVPIDHTPVLLAAVLGHTDKVDISAEEERLIEQLNEWLIPNKHQIIVTGREPGDLLLLNTNTDGEPVDAYGGPWWAE